MSINHFKVGDIVMPLKNCGITLEDRMWPLLAMDRKIRPEERNYVTVNADSFISPIVHKGYQVITEQIDFTDENGEPFRDAILAKSLETEIIYIFPVDDVICKDHHFGVGSYYLIDDNSYAHEVGKRKHIQILCPIDGNIEDYPDDGVPVLITKGPYKRKIKVETGEYKTYDFVTVHSFETNKDYVVLYEPLQEVELNY